MNEGVPRPGGGDSEPTYLPQLGGIVVGAATVAAGVAVGSAGGGLAAAPLLWDGTNRVVKNTAELIAAGTASRAKQQAVEKVFESFAAPEIVPALAEAVARAHGKESTADAIAASDRLADMAPLHQDIRKLASALLSRDKATAALQAGALLNDVAKAIDSLPETKDPKVNRPGKGELSSKTQPEEEVLRGFLREIARQRERATDAEKRRMEDMRRVIDGAKGFKDSPRTG